MQLVHVLMRPEHVDIKDSYVAQELTFQMKNSLQINKFSNSMDL